MTKQDLSHEEPDSLGLLGIGECYSLKTGTGCSALESIQRGPSSFPCPEPNCWGRFWAFPAWHTAAVLVADCSEQCTQCLQCSVSEQAEENPVPALKNSDASWEDDLQCGIRKVVPNTW